MIDWNSLPTDKSRHLLNSNAPFLDTATAHCHITFACVTYLANGFNLVDPQYSDEQRLIDVGKGWHGLHLYANESWAQHLLRYAAALDGVEARSVSTSLLTQLTELCSVHSGLLSDEQRTAEAKAGQLMLLPDPRIEHLRVHEEARSLVMRLLAYRQSRKLQHRESSLGKFSIRFAFPSEGYFSTRMSILPSCPLHLCLVRSVVTN
jgi:hypothetical protein